MTQVIRQIIHQFEIQTSFSCNKITETILHLPDNKANISSCNVRIVIKQINIPHENIV